MAVMMVVKDCAVAKGRTRLSLVSQFPVAFFDLEREYSTFEQLLIWTGSVVGSNLFMNQLQTVDQKIADFYLPTKRWWTLMLKSLRFNAFIDSASYSSDRSSYSCMLLIFLMLVCGTASFLSKTLILLPFCLKWAIVCRTLGATRGVRILVMITNMVNQIRLQLHIIHIENQSKMADNLSLQLDPKRIRQQHDLKKVLPRGSCSIDQYNKYEYIRAFLKDRFLYRYILPINHIYAPFVVIKRMPQDEKFPIFQLYHHPTNTFVLAAQEQNMNIGCNYLVSIKQKPAKNQFFVAKLRGNFNRNQFSIFDNGSNPQRSKSNPRKHLAYITLEEGSLWSKNQKMAMYVPRAYESNRSISEIHKYQPIEFICQTKNPNPIMADYKEKYNTVESLQLKSAQIKQNSAQTFVLESSVRTETVSIRKKSETYYQLGIGSPLTIVQGFGFLLAMIQAKLL